MAVFSANSFRFFQKIGIIAQKIKQHQNTWKWAIFVIMVPLAFLWSFYRWSQNLQQDSTPVEVVVYGKQRESKEGS